MENFIFKPAAHSIVFSPILYIPTATSAFIAPVSTLCILFKINLCTAEEECRADDAPQTWEIGDLRRLPRDR